MLHGQGSKQHNKPAESVHPRAPLLPVRRAPRLGHGVRGLVGKPRIAAGEAALVQFDDIPVCGQSILDPALFLAFCFPRELVPGLPQLSLGRQRCQHKLSRHVADARRLEVYKPIQNAIDYSQPVLIGQSHYCQLIITMGGGLQSFTFVSIP